MKPLPVRPLSVPRRPGLHRHRGADPGARDWRDDGHLHADSRRDAAVAAGRRSVAALSHRRRRQLLRQGGPQDRWGMFSYPAVRAPQRRPAGIRVLTAFQAGTGRMSVRRQGVGRRAAAAPLDLCHRQLLRDARRQRVRGRVLRRRRPPARRARRRDGVSRLAGVYGGDPAMIGATSDRGPAVHGGRASRRRDSSARRSAPIRRICGSRCSRNRSSRAARRRCCASRSRPGCGSSDGFVRARRRGHGRAAHGRPASVDAARGRLPGQLDAGHRADADRTRRSRWCPRAPASAS